MFNDKYGLTKAVLDGSKTVTRRVIGNIDYFINCVFGEPQPMQDGLYGAVYNGNDVSIKPMHKVGEIVAVAQAYQDFAYSNKQPLPMLCQPICEAIAEEHDVHLWEVANLAGFKSKMFVKADLMPHQIKILSVRAERLQDISDADCIKEGVYKVKDGEMYLIDNNCKWVFKHPKLAFTWLINKISGKGTWLSNPFVWVYEFELVK